MVVCAAVGTRIDDFKEEICVSLEAIRVSVRV